MQFVVRKLWCLNYRWGMKNETNLTGYAREKPGDCYCSLTDIFVRLCICLHSCWFEIWSCILRAKHFLFKILLFFHFWNKISFVRTKNTPRKTHTLLFQGSINVPDGSYTLFFFVCFLLCRTFYLKFVLFFVSRSNSTL